MRAVVLWIFAAVFGSYAWAETISRSAFTDHVIAALKSEGLANCVRRLDEGGFSFGPDEADCDGLRIFTDNQYQAYLLDPENKSTYAGKLISVARDALAAAEEGVAYPSDYMESLVVIVRPEDYGSELGGDAHKDMISRPLTGTYRIFLAFDSPDRLMATGRGGMPFIGMSDHELFSLLLRTPGNGWAW